MSFLNKLTFHNAKKLVSATTAPSDHPTEAADPGFEAAVGEFNSYHDSLTAIDRSMSEYAKHMYDLYNSSVNIIDAMAHAISNNDAATLRNTFANTRDAHAILTSDREATISADLRANCIKPLQDELTLHTKLQDAIKQRNDLARELDYYSGKMGSLLSDKAKTEAKGKPADTEKIERNQKKKDEASSMYTVVNAEVITQLQATVMRKGELLTQVFNSFEHIERQVAQTYLAAVSNGTGGAVASSSSSISSMLGAAGASSSSGVTVGEFTSRMGDMGKHRGSGVGEDGGVAISLGMEGQPDVVSTTRSSTLSATNRSSGSYRPITPPPPSYTASAMLPAPVAASRSRPSSPQPQPPPPPPPPPAHHL